MFSIFYDDDDNSPAPKAEAAEDLFWTDGEYFTFYPQEQPKQKRDPDGCFCVKCKEFFPYAEPNLSNDVFKCWSCRNF